MPVATIGKNSAEYELRTKRPLPPPYDKIVFKALVPDPLVTFSDAGAPSGTRVYLNHVSLMPYFTGEE